MNQKQIIKFVPNTREADILQIQVSPATKHIPEWYKKIPQYIPPDKEPKLIQGLNNSTVKNCTPFLDAMSSGYILELSADILVSWNGDIPAFNWRDTNILITDHSLEQFFGIPTPEDCIAVVLKWHNEWGIETPKGYSLLCTHPVNRFDLPWQGITGVVDTDGYSLPIQFPFFVKKGWSGVIEKGTPLVQLIPFKRDNWESSIEEYDEKEQRRKTNSFRGKILRSYKTQFWSKKTYQ